MVVWRLNPGLEKKFHLGHPWVFSNELAHSPKGLPPGAQVELRDSADRFLAVGYGHPNSLISFRTLSRNPDETTINADFVYRRLKRALDLRVRSGLSPWSFRLCFAEADGMPGLVVDRFVLEPLDGSVREQAFVVQASTAGMELLKPFIYDALARLAAEEAALRVSPPANQKFGGAPTWVIESDDSGARKLEGLALAPKRAIVTPKGKDAVELSMARVSLEPSASGLPSVVMQADLIGGQKTGFFLDQRQNVKLAAGLLPTMRGGHKEPLRILDLCCYVGQWSTQLAATARAHGWEVEATLVDASERALELAKANVQAQGATAITERLDVLASLRLLPERQYDVVVCDPPAFIKKKKDLPTGQAAYAKLNREALRRLAPGGLFVTCSCSGLLGDEEFRSALARASSSNSDLDLRYVAKGSHASDHPQLPQFPQGSYLKCWIALAAKAPQSEGQSL